MKRALRIHIILLFAGLAAILAGCLFAGCTPSSHASRTYRVLAIHSYHEECHWAPEMNKGINDCFRKHHIPTEIETFYLDCEYLIANQEINALNQLMEKHKDNVPDLILVCDDQATYSLLKTEHPLTHTVPIVFSGVDYPNQEVLQGHPNVTGFTTTPDFQKCYDLIFKIYPETSNIAITINSSYLAKKAVACWESQIKDDSLRQITGIRNVDLDLGKALMWRLSLSKFPHIFPVWDIFYSGFTRNTFHPVFSINNEGFGNGYLGGYMTPSYDQTYMAAERGIQILKGTPAEHFPIEPSKQVPIFDWREMQHFNIKKSQLPPDSIVVYEPFTTKYRKELICSSVILGTLIIGLILHFSWLLNKERKSKREAQKMLEMHRDKLKIIMKSIREGVISINRDMEIFAINPPALRRLKLEGKEADYVGRNILSLINVSVPGRAHYLKEMISSILKKQKNISFEYASQLTSLDAQWTFPAIGELSGIYQEQELFGIVITFHDITEDFTQKEFLALTLGTGNIASWHFNFDNQSLVFDKTFFHIFNVEDDGSHSILFADFIEMIHPDDHERWEKAHAEIKSGKQSHFSLQLRVDFNGMGYKWWEYRLTYLPPSTPDSHPMVFGLCLSIHKFKQTEEELKTARDKAQQSDKLKSAFLANMSHEIRTPLNAIVGFSNLLTGDEEYEPEEKQLFIETIQNNCNLLLALLTDILDLARIESETMLFKEEICDVNEMINQIATTQQVIIPSHLKLLVDIPVETFFLKIDKLRLNQVLTNLINNAVKFTEKGAVTVGYTHGKDGYLHFFVQDTGKGIPEKDLQNVFQRFFKKDDKAQGAGLGLSICKMIVDHFKGSIDVTSEVGKGSRFTVKIPYMENLPLSLSSSSFASNNNSNNVNREIMETTTTGSANNNRVNILIAEDEESNYLLLKTILQKRCNLFRARTGVEAIQIYKEHLEVNMILMDIKMPEMNGIDTVREIRKLSKDVPIIMQSAYVFDSDMEKAEQAGASGFLTKPISVKLLEETILKYFPFIEW